MKGSLHNTIDTTVIPMKDTHVSDGSMNDPAVRVLKLIDFNVLVSLTPSFFRNIGIALYNELKIVFKNFWSEIVLGKSLTDQTQTIKKQVSVSFGSGKYEEGGGEFKIRDVQLSSERKAATEFEQTFGNTVLS